MNVFYNLTEKKGSWYKKVDELNFGIGNTVSWKYIKDFYARQVPFFIDNNYPWINSGLKNSTTYKIRYLPHLKLIQIAFQQSSGKFDWFINFLWFPMFRIKPYKNMPVVYKTHMGFTKSYKSVRDEIFQKIEEICKNNEVTDIEVFGWSYGGAMTQLCVEDLTFNFIENQEHNDWFGNKTPLITGMTIGAPRVFFKTNKKSWETIQKRFSRLIMIANVNDIVTHCPPSITGCKHIIPLLGVGGKRANLFKLFKATTYHQMSEYTKEINKQED